MVIGSRTQHKCRDSVRAMLHHAVATDMYCTAVQVAKLVAEIFAEMTFIFGDVHCDPHQVRAA